MLSTNPNSAKGTNQTAMLSTRPTLPIQLNPPSVMLSTSPTVPTAHNMPTSGIICKGHVSQSSSRSSSRSHHRAEGEVLHLEEDSTDIGSAASDVEAPHSQFSSCFSTPCVTDNEDEKGKDRLRLTQVNFKELKRRRNFVGTPLEPIAGTPAGMSEHPPTFHIESGTQSEESEQPKDGFRRPPGLFSPQRCRRTRGTALLSTAAELPARRSRGILNKRVPKAVVTQPVLSTAPEDLSDDAHVLPFSPTRRARLAIINLAKCSEAPLKVQMETDINLTTTTLAKALLDPMVPVKKKPIFSDDRQMATIGEPVKKRVTPWLLAEPECVIVLTAVPR